MALGKDRPDAPEFRDPDSEGLRAIKERIAEYKADGRDTSYLEEQAAEIGNRLKGRRQSDEVDRADSTDGAAEMKKAEKARAASSDENKDGAKPEAKSSAVEDGVKTPDDAPGAKSSVPDQVTNPAERVDGPQKKDTSVPDAGPKRTDKNVSSAASSRPAESDKKSPSREATKVANNDKK